MEISVREAARRLHRDERLVRRLIYAGDLSARQVGRHWLVAEDDVARLQGRRSPRGRPLGPRRAWALLDLLDGGPAEWVSSSARSQVRASARRLAQAGPDRWRAAVRGRSEVVRCVAHPAALRRLVSGDGVLIAGEDEAARRGFDLVVGGGGVMHVYAVPSLWPDLQRSLAIQPAPSGEVANLLVQLPRLVWPFRGEKVSDAALAADLLDSAEPRAVRAGSQRLEELVETMGQ